MTLENRKVLFEALPTFRAVEATTATQKTFISTRITTTMKQQTILFLLFLLTANCPSEGSHLRQRQRRVANEEEKSASGTRIWARVKGIRGRRRARKCAQRILHENENDEFMVFEGSELCLEQLQRDPDVLEVDIDNQVHALGEITDKHRTLDEIIPWGLEMIQADQLETGDNEITICIVDSGISFGHPEFNATMINGTDNELFWGPVWNWDKDVSGHGTHVAGTLAAMSGNDLGVQGAGKFKLHITRALDDDGRGYESDIRKAVERCVEVGAQIINLSLGGPYMSRPSETLYTRLVEEEGILLVAAAARLPSWDCERFGRCRVGSPPVEPCLPFAASPRDGPRQARSRSARWHVRSRV